MRRPRRGSPSTCSGATPLTVSPRLQAAEVGAGRDAEPRGGLGVEAPGPVVLGERVAVRAHAVLDRERRDRRSRRSATSSCGSSSSSDERVGDPPPRRAHRVEQRLEAGRAVDRQRPLAPAQVERLEHPDQPEPVVEVVVGDEDRVELRQPDRAQQLLLGALAAVEQDAVAAGAQQQRGQAAPRGRDRAGGAGEEEREVHVQRGG